MSHSVSKAIKSVIQNPDPENPHWDCVGRFVLRHAREAAKRRHGQDEDVDDFVQQLALKAQELIQRVDVGDEVVRDRRRLRIKIHKMADLLQLNAKHLAKPEPIRIQSLGFPLSYYNDETMHLMRDWLETKSGKELEVAKGVVEGLKNSEVSERTGIPLRTVQRYALDLQNDFKRFAKLNSSTKTL